MPTIPSIRTSVENKDVLVMDEHAKKGVFKRDARGRLIAYTGGFSVVFPYEDAHGGKWAFRCWHSDVNNSQKRYELIAKAIQKAHLDFLCGFEYIEKGINVEGTIYPTTRMRWIDGITIKDYICQNKNSKNQLLELADNFLNMSHAMHDQLLAHGDLQHGNILVSPDNKLYLVDYDSFYCPNLKGESDTVTGLPDYQHPSRKNNKYVSEKLDYFSELIIYLSILAIAENPSLAEKYQVADADRMLFTKDDFVDITNSQIYKDIQALGGKFKDLLDVLEGYLKEKSIDALRPFNEQIIDNKITFKASATKAIRSQQSIRVFWQVPFEADVTLKQRGIPNIEKGNQGSVNVTLDEDAEFELTINMKDGTQITRTIKINVFDECKIDFSADKEYVFPSLPVLLTWNVSNANKVWLGSEEVEPCGSKIVEPTSDTVYILQAKDEFGMKNERLTIKTFPIKQAKILLASPPNFTIKQSFSVTRPKYNVEVKFPQINIDWINVNFPKVPSLKETGLFQKLSPPLPEYNLNFLSSIKKVFNHIIKK